jgi:nitrogen regulatory protein PII
MKRITALLHTNRVADVLHAIEGVGERRVSITEARGLLHTSNVRELDYSVQMGERMTIQAQVDVFCDDTQLEALVAVIRKHGHSGMPRSGWIFVSPIELGAAID